MSDNKEKLSPLSIKSIKKPNSLPVYSNKGDYVLGVVAAHVPSKYLDERMVRIGDTGETVLAKRTDNGDARFITSVLFFEDSVFNLIVDQEDLNVPIIQALNKNESTFKDVLDYRGEPIIAATNYIEEYDLGLVAKMDKSEAFVKIYTL